MICIIDFGSTKTGAIAAMLDTLEQTHVTVKDAAFDPALISNAGGFILSGAPVLLTATDPLPYLRKYTFLGKVDVPVLGICFGHQLLGLLHGASIFKGVEMRAPAMIRISTPTALFAGFPPQVLLQEDHTEGITLPEGFLRLASSSQYEVEAMKHPHKPLYGVQFHPETSGEAGLQLLRNFVGMISSEPVR